MEKLFIYDLETTGVKFWKNGIIQIAFFIVINGEVKERAELKVKPHERAEIEDEALAVNGITRADLEAFPDMKIVYIKIAETLAKYVDKYNRSDKFHLVGYNNASFDNQFFRAFFTQNDDKYFGSWFWADSLDVMVLASNRLRKVRAELKDFKLKTVAEFLGIPVVEERLHDAEYDLELTHEIFKIVAE